jgi:hypothetical protein
MLATSGNTKKNRKRCHFEQIQSTRAKHQGNLGEHGRARDRILDHHRQG